MTGDDEASEGADTPEDGTSTGFTPRGTNVVGQLNDHVKEHEFVAEMGITVERYKDGVLTATVPYNEKYANPGMDGTLHGGIIASILDTVMGFTIMAEISQRESMTMGPTISLTINYALAATEECEVTGEIVHIGSSTAIVEGRLQGCKSGEVVSTADGVWRVYDSE